MNIRRIVLFAVSIGCVAGSALAETEFSPKQLSACTDDIRSYCQNIKSGGGRVINCLRDNQTKIADACKLAAVTPSDFATQNEAGVVLAITITGIKSNDGFIWLTLSDESNFPQGRRTIVVPAKTGSIDVTYHRLKPGKYAVLAYHDENDNGKMDMSIVGIPKEGMSSSNNPPGFPTFDSSAVNVAKDTNIKMPMNYP